MHATHPLIVIDPCAKYGKPLMSKQIKVTGQTRICIDRLRDLRNESNIFLVDRGINQKRTENCINARSALLQKFSVLFLVDTSIN